MSSAYLIGPLALSAINDLQASRLQKREIEAGRQRRLGEIRTRQQVRERRRQRELAHASAAARARFGAQGRGSDGGAATAILNGLIAESRRLADDDRRLDDLGIDTANSRAGFAKRHNLLATRARISERLLGAGLSLLG